MGVGVWLLATGQARESWRMGVTCGVVVGWCHFGWKEEYVLTTVELWMMVDRHLKDETDG